MMGSPDQFSQEGYACPELNNMTVQYDTTIDLWTATAQSYKTDSIEVVYPERIYCSEDSSLITCGDAAHPITAEYSKENMTKSVAVLFST